MPSATKMEAKRQILVDVGVLEVRGNSLACIEDYEFSSPSCAGSLVKGGAANGLVAWKNKDGISLKDLERSDEEPKNEV